MFVAWKPVFGMRADFCGVKAEFWFCGMRAKNFVAWEPNFVCGMEAGFCGIEADFCLFGVKARFCGMEAEFFENQVLFCWHGSQIFYFWHESQVFVLLAWKPDFWFLA